MLTRYIRNNLYTNIRHDRSHRLHLNVDSLVMNHIELNSFDITTLEYRNVETTSLFVRVLYICVFVYCHTSVQLLTEKAMLHGCGGLTFCVCAGIESEWRKTQCMPREVCVDVGREFGAPTNIFYKPPCVSVYRCGGCCHSEDKQCRNISTGYLSKTVSTALFIFFFSLFIKLHFVMFMFYYFKKKLSHL